MPVTEQQKIAAVLVLRNLVANPLELDVLVKDRARDLLSIISPSDHPNFFVANLATARNPGLTTARLRALDNLEKMFRR